ncbi:MAG: DUF2868 domain-containing protein [Rhizobacter sp.]|nr:DUF2868 domain-containing protein [Rhizobacter sp.]
MHGRAVVPAARDQGPVRGTPGGGAMNEAQARQVLLLQAFENVGTAGPGDAAAWTAQDAAWASRTARESVSADAAPERYLAERARHAMQRLAPREAAVQRCLAGRLWRPMWLVLAVLFGLLLGVAADSVGGSRRIDLLAPPVWGVIVWNLAVYGLLLWGALRALLARRRTAPGAWSRWLHHLLGPARALRSDARAKTTSLTPDVATVMQRFGAVWTRASTPLTAARVGALFHVAAASLALGLMLGMYLRGLVLDYRAGWESTFLDADTVQSALTLLLSPALALSGIALPDAAGFEAMRLGPGNAAASEPAAPWIHLYALMLVVVVVLPRLLLWLWGGLGAWRLARHFPLALHDAYFQRLLRHRQGQAVHVHVLPYAQAPGPKALQGLNALFMQVYGDAVQATVATEVAFGAEEDIEPAALLPADATLAVALFDLTATPEMENHGRFVRLLAEGAPGGRQVAVLMMVNESAFRQRFGAQPGRLVARREAWLQLAESLGTLPVWVDLEAPDLAATEQMLQSAIARPAQPHTR